MDIKTRKEGVYTIISLSGEVDLHFSPRAREQILKCLDDKDNVLVDLSGVEYIDSSGIASLVEGYQVAKNNGLKFGLISVSNPAMQVIQLSRLDTVFPIHNSLKDRMEQGI